MHFKLVCTMAVLKELPSQGNICGLLSQLNKTRHLRFGSEKPKQRQCSHQNQTIIIRIIFVSLTHIMAISSQYKLLVFVIQTF